VIGDILQPTHLLFVLVIALLVLGPKRLPEVGRALGRGLRDFRSALSTDELREHMVSSADLSSPPPAVPPTSTVAHSPAPTPAHDDSGHSQPDPPAPSNGSTSSSTEPATIPFGPDQA
jgi:sec-independent protein translocase protein TatA